MKCRPLMGRIQSSRSLDGAPAPAPEVDPLVFNMLAEDPGPVSYQSVGGLAEQIRGMREVLPAGLPGRSETPERTQKT